MKMIGILAIVVGALELANTAGAVVARGPGGRTATGLAVITLVFAVSALLLGSGIALLARGPRAINLARVAALSCLVVFAALAALRPGFSIASLLLGMGFPVAALLFLRRRPVHRSGVAQG